MKTSNEKLKELIQGWNKNITDENIQKMKERIQEKKEFV